MCPGNQALDWFTCYVLCRHARHYGTLHCHRQNTLRKSLHFFFLCLFLSFRPLILLLSFLPLIIFLSWFPYLWLYFPYVSIPLLPSSVFVFFSLSSKEHRSEVVIFPASCTEFSSRLFTILSKGILWSFSYVSVTNAVILTTARSLYQPSYYYVQQKALLGNDMWHKQIKKYEIITMVIKWNILLLKTNSSSDMEQISPIWMTDNFRQPISSAIKNNPNI